MSYKPDEREWMAYLYGELEGEEKERIDQYLLEHAEARKTLEEFKQLRSLLTAVEDKEVIAPPIVIGETKQRFTWNIPYFRTIASIAASLILVILIGRFAGVQVSIANREFKMSFGTTQPVQQPLERSDEDRLTPQQVQEMINASLKNNNTAMQASLDETQQKLEASIRKNMNLGSDRINTLVREASSASQDQIRQYVSSIQAENMQLVKDYFQLTSVEQKKYIEDILVDFAQYLQQQRNNDLQLVQTQLDKLQQNTDLFKQETEQILTSIITTVGTATPKENKN
jgi:hypothetical protein